MRAEVIPGLSERAAIDALETNLWSMWSAFGVADGASLIDTPELFAFETPVARIPYNAVMRTNVESGLDARIEQLIDDRINSCRDRNVPLVWLVNPTASPADLRARLNERNLVHIEDLLGMVGDITDIGDVPADMPDGVEVVSRRPDEPHDWMDLVSWRYDIPAEQSSFLREVYRLAEVDRKTLLWVAVRDGKAISKAAVHLAGGTAGVYGVATTDEARGLGLARLCTVRALQDARSRGYTTSVLHSTPMAVSLYEALGFVQVAPFELFTEPGALDLDSA